MHTFVYNSIGKTSRKKVTYMMGKSTLVILVTASLRRGWEEGLGESNQIKITLQNNNSIEKQVEKTNKENMGVKQRKTFDDIKDGDVYHDARIGRDFTKKSKSKCQIIYGKANVSKDDTINQY